jgi:LacI family transcriptional regulator
MGIVGFDDNTHFALFTPSITAVAQPVKEISTMVIRILISSLEEKDSKKRKRQKIELKTSLVIRDSSVRNNGKQLKTAAENFLSK